MRHASELLATNASGSQTLTSQSISNDPVGSLLTLAAQSAGRLDRLGLNATALSDEEEMKLGESLDREITQGSQVVMDAKNLTRLGALAKPLIAQCQRKRITFRIRILKSSQVNAFSIAGGYIYFTTAYLERISNDDHLAMTLAHEIGHVELKHAVEKVQYLYHAKKKVGEIAEIAQLAYSVLNAPYTKVQEFYADAWGFDACQKIGRKPEALLSIFDTFIQLEKEEAARQSARPGAPDSKIETTLIEYFSSHPETAARRARLEAKLQAAPSN